MDKGIIVHSAIINNGKLLILKRIADTYLGNYWDLPGGTLEDGEDPATGATRETFEETGIKISELRLFHYYSNVDKKKNKQFVTLIFKAKAESDLSEILLNSREHSDFKWVDLKDVSKYQTVNYLPSCVELLEKEKEV